MYAQIRNTPNTQDFWIGRILENRRVEMPTGTNSVVINTTPACPQDLWKAGWCTWETSQADISGSREHFKIPTSYKFQKNYAVKLLSPLKGPKVLPGRGDPCHYYYPFHLISISRQWAHIRTLILENLLNDLIFPSPNYSIHIRSPLKNQILNI